MKIVFDTETEEQDKVVQEHPARCALCGEDHAYSECSKINKDRVSALYTWSAVV